MSGKNFEERYRNGDMPWDHDQADANLDRIVQHFKIPAGRAIDIGCGTGDNAIRLAAHGFIVTGIDLSETALKLARGKPGAERCRFLVADFLEEEVPGLPYSFAFDRGCFHSVKSLGACDAFAQRVHELLDQDGLWLSLIGNADELGRESGPPQMSAQEIAAVVEPWFEIIRLEGGHFEAGQDDPPRAWICLMKKRERYQR